MRALTDRQREVLNFIAQFTEDNGFPPTVREIGENFSISLRAVQDHVAALQKKGYITLSQKRSRSIRVIKDERNRESSCFIARIPVMEGYFANRTPSSSEEDLVSFINVAEPFVKSDRTYFAIRVPNDSLSGIGILENDFAVIEQVSIIEEGQIVLAQIDSGAVLRKYYREANRIRLQAENPSYQNIYCQDVKIIGVMVGLLRSY